MAIFVLFAAAAGARVVAADGLFGTNGLRYLSCARVLFGGVATALKVVFLRTVTAIIGAFLLRLAHLFWLAHWNLTAHQYRGNFAVHIVDHAFEQVERLEFVDE